MSGYDGKKIYNNYTYSHNQLSPDNPFRFIGKSFEPYQPKITNQNLQYQTNTVQDYQNNQKTSPYGRPTYNNLKTINENKPWMKTGSTSSLINNSYNIINNFSNIKNQNYNYNNNIKPQQMDHVGDLLNYTIREEPNFYTSNTNKNIHTNNNIDNQNRNNINNNLNQSPFTPYSTLKSSKTPQKNLYNNYSSIKKIENIEDKISNINEFTNSQFNNINKNRDNDRSFTPQIFDNQYYKKNNTFNEAKNNLQSYNYINKYNNENKYQNINLNLNNNRNSLNSNINNIITNNNNINTYIEEKMSNTELSEYSEENCNSIKSYAYKENPNSGNRDYMEDKGRVIQNINGDPNSSLFCLFDGHGGKEVSTFLQQNFYQYFKEMLPFDNVNENLTTLFKKVDEKIKESNFYRVGATACIIYITKENGQRCLYSANIGDTRSVLISSNEYRRLSYDHRASDPLENERISNDGGIVYMGRVFGQLMLSRAFGDWEIKRFGVITDPHVTRINITDNDKYVIVATDGIWDVLDDKDVYLLANNIDNSKELCNIIIQKALEKGSTDNISCFVIKLN